MFLRLGFLLSRRGQSSADPSNKFLSSPVSAKVYTRSEGDLGCRGLSGLNAAAQNLPSPSECKCTLRIPASHPNPANRLAAAMIEFSHDRRSSHAVELGAIVPNQFLFDFFGHSFEIALDYRW